MINLANIDTPNYSFKEINLTDPGKYEIVDTPPGYNNSKEFIEIKLNECINNFKIISKIIEKLDSKIIIP